jgi:hypothetical protein
VHRRVSVTFSDQVRKVVSAPGSGERLFPIWVVVLLPAPWIGWTPLFAGFVSLPLSSAHQDGCDAMGTPVVARSVV